MNDSVKETLILIIRHMLQNCMRICDPLTRHELICFDIVIQKLFCNIQLHYIGRNNTFDILFLAFLNYFIHLDGSITLSFYFSAQIFFDKTFVGIQYVLKELFRVSPGF